MVKSKMKKIKFQSLFQWISHWNLLEDFYFILTENVSILILVDQSLELLVVDHLPVLMLGFNPYFSGSVTGTNFPGPGFFWSESFNPYFSGSVTGTKYPDLKMKNIPSFNPYFSGSVTGTLIWRSNHKRTSIVSILILVDQSLELANHLQALMWLRSFNPYFSGSVTGTRVEGGMPRIVSEFQSLFQWISHWNSLMFLMRVELSSFNPYFSGSVTGTRKHRSELIKTIQFQSLFQWISHWNHHYYTQNSRINKVSILILVDQSLEQFSARPLQVTMLSFNPYFSGSVTGTVIAAITAAVSDSFNPYFSGSVTGT